ncbi:unnamed protein product [Cyclocybe aegerita]|uniref:Rab-GAP TBC domain-containing protein n=1 Tax=Cyclocybe aegerita TaxID=1973307 RepID=A0A8S0W5X4_CYCAE|nr:unnamed protein product [Cyclocybe aegerita]
MFTTSAHIEALQSLYTRLFASGTILSKLKDATISEKLYSGATDSITISGRSLAWKLFLAKGGPLQDSLPPKASSLLELTRHSRKKFSELLEERMQPPDVRLGLRSHPAITKQKSTESESSLDMNNPLSLHNENPWNEWFSGLELRKVIAQDVERTFPDIPFFRESDIQDQLTDILFLYSVLHPSIGYRQGMHELLAPLYLAVNFDSITDDEVQDEQFKDMREICSADFVAADSWALFNSVMDGVSRWYEWRDPLEGDASSRSSSSPFFKQAVVSEGQLGISPYVAPIVQACNRIQSTLLQTCDPLLYQSMQKVGIEPQIYGIRWLRLLFTREFNIADALKLWDCLFACDASLDLAQWVCVAMLIRIRNELIPADYSSQLTTLLRYPSPSASNRVDGAPHHAILLLRQALALQMAPNPATGATIVMENRSLLNIPIDVPRKPSPPPTKQSRIPRPPSTSSVGLSSQSHSNGKKGGNHSRQASSPALAFSEMLTRGLVERGESLGINKTLYNAVTEIRRNIPELAASLGVRTPTQVTPSFPLIDERPVEERPPWEPLTRFEMEKNISELRSRDKTLGESLAWIVDALLQDESEMGNIEKIQRQKREALESLSYVRDVLMTNTLELDKDRLIGGEEKSRRKLKAQKEAEEVQAASAFALVVPPVPVPVVNSQLKRASDTIRSRPRSPVPPSLPSATHVSKNSAELSQRAPWNRSRSSFGSPTSAVPSALMPRPPPPTSTGLRREGKRASDQTPPANGGYLDPLGALH